LSSIKSFESRPPPSPRPTTLLPVDLAFGVLMNPCPSRPLRPDELLPLIFLLSDAVCWLDLSLRSPLVTDLAVIASLESFLVLSHPSKRFSDNCLSHAESPFRMLARFWTRVEHVTFHVFSSPSVRGPHKGAGDLSYWSGPISPSPLWLYPRNCISPPLIMNTSGCQFLL